ncbi:uncharacterized protein YabE (DUF348 family) [Propionicimonas paludicola]|uniref:Uncharacterized protein YabE (DUF348 family) n=1 Tax=Propionicimonas paludicola TaxID=185243 RepID=A0A2A9CSW3_9ACTN|nr:resuscitation-promoting factor [Propionicimonas paludicola]PFG17533.1 uncharacterized protein YabE (DUF348 family) [Propionicimonas paludicola]
MAFKHLATAAVTLALTGGGVATGAALHKDVRLVVDGVERPTSTFALTVSDVLSANGVTVSGLDQVSPAPQSPVSNGSVITVRYAKPITLTLDGSEGTFMTTEVELADALAAKVPDLNRSWTSVALASPVPRTGLEVTVSTPKQVRLVVDGKTRSITTTANTVDDLLAEQNVTTWAQDRVSPSTQAVLAEGDRVVVQRVRISTLQRTESIAFASKKKSDPTLWLGESRVVSTGKAGKATRIYRVVEIDGKKTDRSLVSETVLAKPVAQVIAVGSKVTGNGAGINLARAAMWDRIARCESGGNWSINTGNGYYGGLQFNLAAWKSNGGRDFAAYPHQASRAEQITVANRYYAKAGTRPWTCA